MRISMKECKNKLAIVWFLGSGFIILVVLFQTLFGRYADKSPLVWASIIPSLIPTLSLILGVLAADALSKKRPSKRMVDKNFFRISLYLSMSYLLILILPFFLMPFLIQTPLEIIKDSQLWLMPLQGLITGTLGAFFYKP